MKAFLGKRWPDILRISLFILLFVGIFRLLPPRGPAQISTTNITEISVEGDPPEMYAFNLWVSLIPPESTANNRLQMRLIELGYELVAPPAGGQPSTGGQFCLTSIASAQILFTPEPLTKDSIFTAPVDENPLCSDDVRSGTIRFPSSDEFTFEAIDEPNTIWYPYDDFQFNLAAEIAFAILGADGEEALLTGSERPVAYRVSVESLNWNYTSGMDRYPAETGEGRYLETSFERSSLTQAFPVVLIAIIYLFILVLYYVEQMSTLLEGSLAALFGIFGVRQVILPASIETQTIWDFLIFLAYIFLGITFLIKYLVMRAAKRREEEEEEEEVEKSDSH